MALFSARPERRRRRAGEERRAQHLPDAKSRPCRLYPRQTREQFRERAQGANHRGEVTTVQRNGVVTFIVLNATVASYPKLKDEYAAFVKSFRTKRTEAGPARNRRHSPFAYA